jgi:hypothetical protein
MRQKQSLQKSTGDGEADGGFFSSAAAFAEGD